MKKTLIVILAFLLVSAPIYAFTVADTDHGKFQFYGFVKLNLTYQDDGMNSFYAPRYANGVGDGVTILSAMDSRFGIKWTGYKLGNGFEVGAGLEWDLFSGTSRNQMRFRTRLAYFTLKKSSSTLLFGQHWDIFSPIGPTTLMTNGYMWQVGNLGFRRAQVRYTYSAEYCDFSASVNDPTSDGGVRSKCPIFEGRFGVKLGGKKKVKFGVSGAYGKDKRENLIYTDDVDVKGLSIDWFIPFADYFTVKGEYGFGENLSIFLSRAGVYDNVALGKYEGQEANSFWTEFIYSGKKANFWVGYSFENLTKERMLTDLSIKDTNCVFVGAQYKVGKGVSLGVEYGRFFSELLDSSLDDYTANQVMFSAIYKF